MAVTHFLAVGGEKALAVADRDGAGRAGGV
jgi:hypothetical protein